MYSWALISAVLSFFFFHRAKPCREEEQREAGTQRESTIWKGNQLVLIRDEYSLAAKPAHGTIILPLSLWTTLAVSFVHGPWIYISFRQRHHKETEEHQFLPATSKRDVRPRRAEWLLCCTLQPGISKAFSFTFIAIMKEQGEHKRGLDSCPPSPLPAF